MKKKTQLEETFEKEKQTFLPMSTISEATRKARRMLMLLSLIGLIVGGFDLQFKSVTILGTQIEGLQTLQLQYILLVLILYFLIEFSLYASADLSQLELGHISDGSKSFLASAWESSDMGDQRYERYVEVMNRQETKDVFSPLLQRLKDIAKPYDTSRKRLRQFDQQLTKVVAIASLLILSVRIVINW